MTNRIEDGDYPAFPITAGNQVYAQGMSLRDWFAGQALAGLLSDSNWKAAASWKVECVRTAVVEEAYRTADAMIAASKGSDH